MKIVLNSINRSFKILVLASLGLCINNVYGQKYYMTSPEGFGAGTTGGGNASPVTVSTYIALQNALTASGPGVILVSGTIDFTNSGMMKVVVTNKTLVGLPGATFTNNNQSVSGILWLYTGSSNVIIRNIKFVGPSAWDNNGNDNITVKSCNKLWIDHCEFQDGEDGNVDNTAMTDNVTISWCKFTYLKSPRTLGSGSGSTNDHRFSNLIGGNSSDAPTDKHYSITWQNCWWAQGCVERMPRARNAELHILNCLYTSSNAKTPIGIGGGVNNSTCYVENSDFSKLSVPAFKSYNSSDGGTVGLTFSGCLNSSGTADGPAAKPSYITSAFPASDVAAAISNASCGAGATLNVTANGVISSNCTTVTSLSYENNDGLEASFIYPNPNTGVFYVKGRENIKSLSILNTNGETVLTWINVSSDNEFEVQTDLAPGVYFLQLQNISGSLETIKLVKSE